MVSINTKSKFYSPLLLAAAKMATRSTYKHRIGAVLAKGSRIISGGHNQFRHHKWSTHYPYKASCHAEVAALLKAGETIPRNTTMYIARINKKGKLRNARPCECCMSVLRLLGVRKIVYSTNGGYRGELV